MTPILLFDETSKPIFQKKSNDKTINGVGFCVIDNKALFLDKIKEYYKIKKIQEDAAHYNENYAHYTEDGYNLRRDFIKYIKDSIAFKSYLTFFNKKMSISDTGKNIYNNRYVYFLVEKYIQRLVKNGISNVELIFEEGKKEDYHNIRNLFKEKNINYSECILKKTDGYSQLTDYILGTTTDFFKLFTSRSKSKKGLTDPREQNFKLLYDNISLLYMDLNTKEYIHPQKDDRVGGYEKIKKALGIG